MAPIRILAVENEEGEDLGLLAAPLRARGVEARSVRAWASEPLPESVDGADGLIVLGGAPSVYDLATGAWMADVMRLIRQAHVARMPVLGVCLGAQLAAHALGGRAVPGTTPEVGFEPIELLPEARGDAILGALPPAPPVFSWHHDTYVPPPGATRLASSARYREQAFRLGRTWGLQFHVDLTPETLAAQLPGDRDLAALGIDAAGLVAEARKREPAMRAVAEAIVGGFLGVVGEPAGHA